MNEPERLLASSDNPEIRSLIEAGQHDKPHASAAQRALLALGVGGGLTATAAVSGAATAGATSITTTASSTGVAALAAKWLVIGVLTGGMTGGGAALLSVRFAPAAPAGAPSYPEKHAALSGRLAAQATPSAAAPAAAIETTELTPPPAASTASALPARATAGSEPAATAAGAASERARLDREAPVHSLAEEVALIDAARGALGLGQATQALTLLERYAAISRTGTLDREAEVLRIDALLQSGERARARELASAYLARYPNDAHAARLRNMLSAGPTPSSP